MGRCKSRIFRASFKTSRSVTAFLIFGVFKEVLLTIKKMSSRFLTIIGYLVTKYEEFRFFDMCQVFSFSLGLSGHLLLIAHIFHTT